MKFKDKVVVVTGGGNGLGRELVLQLLQKGAQVAMVDINAEDMNETRSLADVEEKSLSLHTVDITDRNKVNQLPEEVQKAHGAVDILINNAGIIQPFIKVEKLEMETIEKVMNINFYGTVYMVKAFLPELLKRPEAHIANVSSMGGFIPFPGQTIYSASKAAVKLFTEGLNVELKDTNVGVTIIHPGAMRTQISQHSGLEQEAGSESDSKVKMLEPEVAAEQMLQAIENKKYRVMIGKDAAFLDKFYRLNPRWATHYIARQMEGLLPE